MYDYGKRNYDPTIARWAQVDPKADKYPDMSPYNYVGNNPLIRIDPQGDTIKVIGSEEFQSNAQNDIQTIAQSTENGEQLIDFLQNSEMIIEVNEGISVAGSIKNAISEGSGDINHLLTSGTKMGMTSGKGRPFGVLLTYSRLEGVEYDGTDSKATETLYHEFVHARQYIGGDRDCNSSCMKQGEVRGRMEATAVQETNVYRMETGRSNSLRTEYAGQKVVTPTNQIIPGVIIR